MDLYLIIWSEEEKQFVRMPVPEGTKGMAFVDRHTGQVIDAVISNQDEPIFFAIAVGSNIGIKPIANNTISIEVAN